MNSGYYTLQIYPRVCVNMFRVKPRVTLGLLFFTVLIQNSDKQWKVLSGCLEKVALGIPSGHQTFPRGCAPRESLMTLGNSLGQLFPDNHRGLSTVYTKLYRTKFNIARIARYRPENISFVVNVSSCFIRICHYYYCHYCYYHYCHYYYCHYCHY